MTELTCGACGRGLGGDTAFCPYCGAERHARAPSSAPPSAAAAPAAVPAEAAARTDEVSPHPPEATRAPEPAVPVAPASAEPARTAAPAGPRKRSGCGLPILLALMVLAGALAWWAVRPGASRGALPVVGAVASRPLHVTRRWKRVSLPDDAPAGARFALSSDGVVRVRAAGRVYAVRPGRPLRLPDDMGDGFELRASDTLSAEAAARTQVTLSTLPAPR